jgi:hypothetical protein
VQLLAHVLARYASRAALIEALLVDCCLDARG